MGEGVQRGLGVARQVRALGQITGAAGRLRGALPCTGIYRR